MAQFYNYKERLSYKNVGFACKKCAWRGTGAEAVEGLDSSSGFPLLCPACGEYMDWVDVLVSADELLKYGNDKDKAHARELRAFYSRVELSRTGLRDSLPLTDSDNIVVTLQEEEEEEEERRTANEDGYIVLYFEDKEFWREVRTFEYYDRYLEIGEVLKEEYGERLTDFVAEHTVYLGGDSLSAFDKVENFRKSLRPDDGMEV